MIGAVRELWRYPVKSMRGEQIPDADVHRVIGIPGDRGWAVCDDAVGEIRGAKRYPELLTCAAAYSVEPVGDATPRVMITLPDGNVVHSDDPSIHRVLSDLVGAAVTLWPRVAPTDVEHYRRRDAIDEAEMRRQFGLLDDEPLPDMSVIPAAVMAELMEFASPRGTYFDGFALHLLSTASIAALQRRTPDSLVDVRRFRPNLLVEVTDDEEFPEFAWIGRHVRIGGLTCRIEMAMQRCSMTTHAQAELPRDRNIMRTLVRETSQNLGVAMSVVEPGSVRAGDTIELL
jgi:uncharacterized protein